jgi:hypothetical protein
VEGNVKAVIDVIIAKVSYFDIGDCCDLHADVASNHGSNCSNQETKSSVRETSVEVCLFPGLVNGCEENSAEENNENKQVSVFLLEEGVGSLKYCNY